MKKFIPLLILLFFSVNLFSQNNPVLAPLNPDFVRFMAKLNSGKAPQPGADEFGTGAMPPPGQVNFNSFPESNKLKTADFAPVYDMRTTGLLTPVRGQTQNGCWAFASIASVESSWLKNGLGTWDLSENNLKYCNGFVTSRNEYGNHWMSTAYFARRSGPLVEVDDPNGTSSTCPADKTPAGYITDARYLPNDMNTIKQAILDHGAIYTMMYINTSIAYYNPVDFTYYRGDSADVNHAVDLVGWDDTKVTAGGTGAWICKNSYGTGWGDKGYFYVSYNDKCILDYNAYWPSRIENVPATRIYGYDDLGNYSYAGYYNNKTGYLLVKFIANGSQLLSKVGTYARASGETIDIDIFDNFDIPSNSLSGLLSTQSGFVCPLPGFYTIDLPAPAAISSGNDFYVRIRYQTQDTMRQIPIEKLITGYSTPTIESNIAWISSNPSVYNWYLIGNSTATEKWDPCVKVYAEPVPVLLTWNGSASDNWNEAANWSPALIPDAAKDVLIPDVTVKPVVYQAMAAPALCRNLSVEAGSSVTVNTGKALTVYGTLTNNAGTSGLVIETGASLITKGAVSGEATLYSDISEDKWHFISSPVSDASAGIFSGKYLQKFNESANTYTDITSVSEALVPSHGYALWGNDNGFTAQYKGNLNSGIQTASLTRSATGNLSGWNLAGNPYPSSIDWNAGGWTKTNLNNAIYIENAGGWATYISGAGANGGTQFIAPGQGFMVNVAAAGSGNLGMNDFVRVHNATAFLKSSGSDSLVRIKVSGNGYTDEAVVRFMTEATDEFDGEYDALKLFGYIEESAQIYTLGNIPLTINSILPGNKEVTMGVHAQKSGQYTLTATEVRNVDSVMLEDTKTGIYTNLSVNPYTFSFETGEKEERFKLHFATSDFTGLTEAANTFAGVYSYGQTIFITLKDQQKGDIRVYTVAGQLVASKPSAGGSISLRLPDPGIYIVRIISDGNTVVKKVWVH